MFENIKLLKNWYILAQPSKKYWLISFFMVLLAQACVLVSPVFAAKAVVDIASGAFTDGAINLTIVFGLLVLRNVFWDFNYRVYAQLMGFSYNRLNMEFINKMVRAKPSNFDRVPKEKLINILHNDIFNLADISDKLAICAGRIIYLVATIIIIFTINPWVGLVVLVLDLVNFVVLNKFEMHRVRYVKKMREDHDRQYEKFSEIIDTRDTINNLSVSSELSASYNKILRSYNRNLHKKVVWDSNVAQWFFVLYNFFIWALTLGMVFLTAQGQMSIPMYFLIVPYITIGIETTNKVFEVMPFIKNSGIYVSRIRSVLNFMENDKISYGDIEDSDIIGFMDFNEVSRKGDRENPQINDVTLRIKGNQTTLICGAKSSGKRTLFHLMLRSITPDTGDICMDGLNIFEYSERAYNRSFKHLGTKPTFFKGSILKNLKIVNKNTAKIEKACREVGLWQYIQDLPQKLNTNIHSLPFDKQYMLGLARVLLTGAKVIAIYEFPTNLTQGEKRIVKEVLRSFGGKRTLVIFSANEECADIADKIVTIERGALTNIQLNNNSRG